MTRKWRELAPFYFRATATALLFLALAPPRRAPPRRTPPFSVRTSGAVALKVAQVPSTAFYVIQVFSGLIAEFFICYVSKIFSFAVK